MADFNTSLLQDRQLTPYKVRKNSYSGFFFYLSETDTIYLIDNPGRSEKKIESGVNGLLIKEKELFEQLFSNEDPENDFIYPKSWFSLYKITPVIHGEWTHFLNREYGYNLKNFVSQYCTGFRNAALVISLLSNYLEKYEPNTLIDDLCYERWGHTFAEFQNIVFNELLSVLCSDIKSLQPAEFEQMTYAILYAYKCKSNDSWWMTFIKQRYLNDTISSHQVSPLNKIVGYISLMYWVKSKGRTPHVLIPEDVANVKLTIQERTDFFEYHTKLALSQIREELEADDCRGSIPTEDECKLIFAKKLKAYILNPTFTVDISDNIKNKALSIARGWLQYILPKATTTPASLPISTNGMTTINTTPKFSYIKSDDPIDIKPIEDTLAIYVRGNKPSELCSYLFEHVGDIFLTMPHKAEVIYASIIDRWGDENKISKAGLKMAWKRLKNN